MKSLFFIMVLMPLFSSAQNTYTFASHAKYSVTIAWHSDKLKKAKAKRAQVVKDSLPINSYKFGAIGTSDTVRIKINPVSDFDDETAKWNGTQWVKSENVNDSLDSRFLRKIFASGRIECDHKSWEATTHEETETLKEYMSFECGKCRMIWLTNDTGMMYIHNIEKQLFKKKKQ